MQHLSGLLLPGSDPSLLFSCFPPRWEPGQRRQPPAPQAPRGRESLGRKKKKQYPQLIDAGHLGVSIFCNLGVPTATIETRALAAFVPVMEAER